MGGERRGAPQADVEPRRPREGRPPEAWRLAGATHSQGRRPPRWKTRYAMVFKHLVPARVRSPTPWHYLTDCPAAPRRPVRTENAKMADWLILMRLSCRRIVSAESSALLPSGIINTIVTPSIGLALNGSFCVDPAGRRCFRDPQVVVAGQNRDRPVGQRIASPRDLLAVVPHDLHRDAVGPDDVTLDVIVNTTHAAADLERLRAGAAAIGVFFFVAMMIFPS
jgi:hypothetical protein